jgi:plasmid stabilization system protein ParE
MTPSKVIWTERAIDDLQNIRDFISKFSETEAIKQLQRIFERETQLLTEPRSGGLQHGTISRFELRYLVQDSYKILYRHTEHEVFVLMVFDTRQDPKKLKL